MAVGCWADTCSMEHHSRGITCSSSTALGAWLPWGELSSSRWKNMFCSLYCCTLSPGSDLLTGDSPVLCVLLDWPLGVRAWLWARLCNVGQKGVMERTQQGVGIPNTLAQSPQINNSQAGFHPFLKMSCWRQESCPQAPGTRGTFVPMSADERAKLLSLRSPMRRA